MGVRTVDPEGPSDSSVFRLGADELCGSRRSDATEARRFGWDGSGCAQRSSVPRAARLDPGSELTGLCDRARDLMTGRPHEALDCDVAGVGHPDLLTVEALARIGLVARRHSTGIRLRGASVDLLDLLA